MMKNQKGITLIALVITIIVLLILAGVSIAMLTGQNGILTKAGDATDKTKNAEVEEAIKLTVAEIIADNEGFVNITATNLTDEKLGKMNNNYTFTVKDVAAAENKAAAVEVTAVNGKTTITRYVESSTGKVSETQPTATTTPTEP